MPPHKPARSLVALAALAVAAPAAAYVPMHLNTMPDFAANMARVMMTNHTGQVLMQQKAGGGLGGAQPTLAQPAGAPAAGPAAARPGSTRYTPSPQVSAELKAALLQKASQALGPEAGPKLVAAFANRDPVALWANAMARNGLHPNDVADVLASYFVLNWCMANRADLSTPQVIAVRDQMQRAVASGKVVQLPDAGRQIVAETAMFEFDIQSAVYANALHQHDQAALQKLGDAAEQRFQAEEKIDLRNLAITPEGLTPKA